ncbi:MAG: RrF2 family transcriptional regulator [Limnochordia bacterium]
MIQISEAASLALHSMMVLAQEQNEPLSVDAMAARIDVSRSHLSKVLQRLSKAGLVRGTRGPGGGYALSKPSDEISLLEVYEAIDGPVPRTTCLLGHSKCLLGGCLFGELLAETTRNFREYLAGHSLADIAGKGDST